MEQFVRSCVVQYPDDRMCTLWAALVAATRRIGRQIATQDAWVAASALYLDAPLVTHNAGHYQDVPDLQVVTEPDSES
jgi:predicted nucleic acid-binding protein